VGESPGSSSEGDGSDSELLPGLNAVPGLVRIGADAWFRTAIWGLGATAEAVGGVRRILGDAGDAAPDAVADAVEAVRPTRERERREERRDERARSLRERGGELLDRAADVEDQVDPVHPGFARIIDVLAPDEARILKLLVNEGPQGIVYVNKAAPFGIGAREVARRLSMIGHEAGCLHFELVPAYLDNLVSHGLVAIRRDALEDELPYQVIEAQPEVIEALRVAGGTIFRGQVTRRSVHLTDFGRTFCQVCFPPEHLTGEHRPVEVVDGPAIAAVASPPETTVD